MAAPVPTNSGLLALLYKVHTEPSVRDRFRSEAGFDGLMEEFKIDKETSNLILSLGVNDIATKQGRKSVADAELYKKLLDKLYSQQLGKDEHFLFAW